MTIIVPNKESFIFFMSGLDRAIMKADDWGDNAL